MRLRRHLPLPKTARCPLAKSMLTIVHECVVVDVVVDLIHVHEAFSTVRGAIGDSIPVIDL